MTISGNRSRSNVASRSRLRINLRGKNSIRKIKLRRSRTDSGRGMMKKSDRRLAKRKRRKCKLCLHLLLSRKNPRGRLMFLSRESLSMS